MNNKIIGAIMFTVGAAIGSAVTWKLVKTKYEQIAQDEIDSVKEEYTSLMIKMKKKLKEDATYKPSPDEDESEVEAEDETPEPSQVIEYHKIASRYHNSDENDEEGDEEDDDEDPYINGPYVIPPEDFATNPPGYNTQGLDYFADGVLADNWGMVLDIEETIGEDAINHFGDYVDDILYVRNERTEVDYEVTRDPRTYDEAVRTNPNPYYGKYEN